MKDQQSRSSGNGVTDDALDKELKTLFKRIEAEPLSEEIKQLALRLNIRIYRPTKR